LHIGGVVVAGADRSEFALQRDDCSNRDLGPKQSCTVTVSFTPQSAGNKTASLTLQDDSPGSPHHVSLQGVVSARPSAAFEPNEGLYFGEQNVGGPSRTLGIVLHNTGSTELTPGIRVDGQDADHFPLSQRECNGRALQAGGACNLVVEFRPLREGKFGVTLTAEDEAGRPLARASLSGVGIRSLPLVRTDRPFVDFTKTPIQSLKVTNAGGSPLLIKLAKADGAGAAAITVDASPCLQGPINPADSCEIRLRFSPKSVAAAAGNAYLYIFDNAANSPQRVPMQWHSSGRVITPIEPKPGGTSPVPPKPAGISPIPPKQTVPSVVGLSRSDAELKLKGHGLRLGEVSAGSPQTPAGMVQRQNPPVGSPRPASSRVDVWLSTNQSPVTVPTVTDGTVDQAKQKLAKSNLRLGAIHPLPAQATAGIILRQNPKSGTQVVPGTAVEVWVATPQKVATPTQPPVR
jgi:hypothetical protein